MLKKLKQPSFAAGVHRDEVYAGAELLGLELDQHIANVIEALRPIAGELGLRGGGGLTQRHARGLLRPARVGAELPDARGMCPGRLIVFGSRSWTSEVPGGSTKRQRTGFFSPGRSWPR